MTNFEKFIKTVTPETLKEYYKKLVSDYNDYYVETSYKEVKIFETWLNEEEEQFVFTDKEKALLTLIDSKYNYIARDSNDKIYLYATEPIRRKGSWNMHASDSVYPIFLPISEFGVAFNSVQWIDEKPCEFRKYL